MKMAGKEIGVTQVSFRQMVPGSVQRETEPATAGVSVDNETHGRSAELDDVAIEAIKTDRLTYSSKSGGTVKSPQEFDKILAKMLRNRKDYSICESDSDDTKKTNSDRCHRRNPQSHRCPE